MEIINKMAQECYLKYREALDNESFADLYAALSDIKAHHRAKVLSQAIGDEHDAQSSYDDVLFKVIAKDGITDITRMLYVCLKYERIKLYRKNSRWKERTYFPESEAEFGGCIDRPAPDSIGLLRALIDRSNEPVASLIVNMTLQGEKKESISATCNRAGLHHNTGLRSLRRLKRYYNEEIDGSLSEYLA